MSLTIKKNLVDKSKYGIKCPYAMAYKYVTEHNTDNNAPAKNEVAYMIRNNNQTSFHFAVDDKEAVQGIPTNRNAWHSGDGNGSGNRKSVSIETCYSKSGGDRFTKAEKNSAYLAAILLHNNKLGISRLKRHYDWSGKYCPHRTMDLGWQRFVNMVKAELNKLNGKPETSISDDGKVTKAPNVKHRVYTTKWWSWVTNWNAKNSNGYSGVKGKNLKAFQAYTKGNASVAGQLQYRLRKINGSYYNWQTDRVKDKNGEDFAGDKKSTFDRLQMTLIGLPGYQVEYRVYVAGKGWLPWVRGYNNYNSNGYAGIDGHAIQCVQVRIVKK